MLRDLADRLARTRFPERTAAPWRAGTDPDYLRELITYWHDNFDWRARERELNALPQFTADIDGQRVHFVHVRAPGSGPARPALPLILTHGWPSSFLEMLPLVALLTDPGSHGGDPDDSWRLAACLACSTSPPGTGRKPKPALTLPPGAKSLAARARRPCS